MLYKFCMNFITFEVNFTISIRVKNIDDSLNERILLQFRKRHELVDGKRSWIVQIQFPEPFSQPFNLIRINWKPESSVRTCSMIDTFLVDTFLIDTHR